MLIAYTAKHIIKRKLGEIKYAVYIWLMKSYNDAWKNMDDIFFQQGNAVQALRVGNSETFSLQCTTGTGTQVIQFHPIPCSHQNFVVLVWMNIT